MFDIVIIGAGPSGLFSIFEAGMLGMKCAVVDSLSSIGGQCSTLYPEKPIYDIPAYPKISAQQLIDNLYEQAKPFKPNLFLDQRVNLISKQEDASFIITTTNDNQIRAKTIIIATGGGAFCPNKPLIENIDEFEESGVLYSVPNRNIFNNKRVVIAGGGDSAIDWALSLAEIAQMTYIVHRRDKFKAPHESMRRINELAAQNKIQLIIPYQLYGLSGQDGQLTNVIVKDLDGNIRDIAADYLLPFFGLAMDLGPVENWGLELENKHIVVDQTTMATNIKGIFAIGDIATYPGKLKLILTGFAEAALACHSAYKIISNGVEKHFEYSTTKGVPSLS